MDVDEGPNMRRESQDGLTFLDAWRFTCSIYLFALSARPARSGVLDLALLFTCFCATRAVCNTFKPVTNVLNETKRDIHRKGELIHHHRPKEQVHKVAFKNS